MTLSERVDRFCKTHVVNAAMRQDIILLAKSVAYEAREEARYLESESKRALEVLKEIANEDYRGNRSSAGQKAYYFLRSLRQRGEK